MQIESLKMFCDLAETKSFTKAAQINDVTQSAVSQTISTMERHFKSLLIERSKKNFRLTTEGQVVYDFSKRILQSYDTIENKMQELKGVVSGNIRLATIYSIGLYEIPPCVKRFLELYPGVNVQVEYRRPNRVYEDVLANSADLGLVDYPAASSKLEVIPMRKEPLVLICHPQHPLAKLKTVKLSALAGQKFISFEPDISTRQALDRMFRREHVTVEHVVQLDNIETMKQAVEVNTGLAIVPEKTVRQEVSRKTLVAVKLAGKHTREWGIIYKKDKVLSPAMKEFIKLLKEMHS
jgi:LysR family transcriptional regulator, transcriptional activator of the cysJI operon